MHRKLDNAIIGITFARLIKRNKQIIMKKVFAMFAIAGMLFSASCGNKEVTEETTEEIEVVIEETEEATEEVIEETTEEVETAVEEVVEG